MEDSISYKNTITLLRFVLENSPLKEEKKNYEIPFEDIKILFSIIDKYESKAKDKYEIKKESFKNSKLSDTENIHIILFSYIQCHNFLCLDRCLNSNFKSYYNKFDETFLDLFEKSYVEFIEYKTKNDLISVQDEYLNNLKELMEVITIFKLEKDKVWSSKNCYKIGSLLDRLISDKDFLKDCIRYFNQYYDTVNESSLNEQIEEINIDEKVLLWFRFLKDMEFKGDYDKFNPSRFTICYENKKLQFRNGVHSNHGTKIIHPSFEIISKINCVYEMSEELKRLITKTELKDLNKKIVYISVILYPEITSGSFAHDAMNAKKKIEKIINQTLYNDVLSNSDVVKKMVSLLLNKDEKGKLLYEEMKSFLSVLLDYFLKPESKNVVINSIDDLVKSLFFEDISPITSQLINHLMNLF